MKNNLCALCDFSVFFAVLISSIIASQRSLRARKERKEIHYSLTSQAGNSSRHARPADFAGT